MADAVFQPGDEPVPGFVLVKFLGKGNFGQVWEARASGDVRVAMKILSGIDRRAGRKAFGALQLVKNLNHINLVTIIGFWLKDENGNLLRNVVDPGFSDETSGHPFHPDDTIVESGLTETIVPDSEIGLTATINPNDVDVSATISPDEAVASDAIRQTPGAAEHPAQLFIAMGLAEETLEQCLERHQKTQAAEKTSEESLEQIKSGIPYPELLRYMEGAAKGLDFLNIDHNIQHGDIKPANIMIVGGETQVSDFDLARNLIDLESTGTRVGTLAYMPPEVCTDGEAVRSSDLYSLAISYYELRTGKLPYSKTTVKAVVAEKTAGQLDLSQLPKAERKAIEKAISLDPNARHASCMELVEELRGERTSWRRVLKNTVGALALLAAVMATWQLAAPERYKPTGLASSYIGHQSRYRELQEIMEPDETGQSSLSAAKMLSAFGLLERLSAGANQQEKAELGAWSAQLIGGAFAELEAELLECQDEMDIKKLTSRPLYSRTKDHVAEITTWLAPDDDNCREAQWKQSLLDARVQLFQSAVDIKAVRTRLTKASRPAAVQPSDQAALLAIDIMAAEPQADPAGLNPQVVHPLAQLMEIDEQFVLLTEPEKSRANASREKIRRQTLAYLEQTTDQVGNSGSPIPDTIAADLETVTGFPVSVFLQLNEVRTAIEGDAYGEAASQLQGIYSDFSTVIGGRPNDQRAQEALEQVEELELLLFLRDLDSSVLALAPSAGDSAARTPSAQVQKLLTEKLKNNRLPSYGVERFCEAMLLRAEADVLGRLKGTALPRQDIDGLFQQERVAEELGVTADAYRCWWNWIVGVGNINPQVKQYMDYSQWERLFEPFPEDSEIQSQVAQRLAALVQLCRTECQVVSQIGRLNWSMPSSQQSEFRASLASLNDAGTETFSAYVLFCRALDRYVSDSSLPDTNELAENQLLDAAATLANQLTGSISLQDLLRSRPQRLELATKIALRATLAASGQPEDASTVGIVNNPYRAGGAEAAFSVLQFVCHQANANTAVSELDTAVAAPDLSHVSPEVLRLAILAAFFKQKPDYAVAERLASSFLEPYNDRDANTVTALAPTQLRELAEVSLVSARANVALAQASANQQADKQVALAAALHSYAALGRWLGNDNRYQQLGVSGVELTAVLDEAIQFIEESSLGTMVRKLQARPALPEVQDDALSERTAIASEALPMSDIQLDLQHDLAAIYAARALLISRKNDSDLGQLERDRKKRQYLFVAIECDDQQVSYLFDYAVACLALPEFQSNDRAEIALLDDVTGRIAAIDPSHPGKKHLEGRMLVVEARGEVDRAPRIDKLERAIQLIDTLDDTSEDAFTHLLRYTKATASFELASQLKPREDHRPRISQLLGDTIATCNELESSPLTEGPMKGQVYLLWAHALEDREFLAGEEGNYETAIPMFERANQNENSPSDSTRLNCNLGMARTAFRLQLTGRPPVQDHDLAVEFKRLESVVNRPFIEEEYAAICAECYVYMGRIRLYELHEQGAATFALATTPQRDAAQTETLTMQIATALEAGSEAAGNFSEAVRVAYIASLPVRFEWKLEQAQAEVENASFCNYLANVLGADAGGELASGKTNSLAAAKKLATELLQGDLLKPAEEGAGVSPDHATIAASAVFSVLMQIGLDVDTLDGLVTATVQQIQTPDLQCLLTLGYARYLAYRPDFTPELLEPSLQRVGEISQADRQQFPLSPIWLARVPGVRAICKYKQYYWSLEQSDTGNGDLGLVAFDQLLQAIEALESVADAARESDLVWLRYTLGTVAYRLFCLDRDLIVELTKQVGRDDVAKRGKQAVTQLNKIEEELRQRRVARLNRKGTLIDRWDWGVYELRDLQHPEFPIDDMLRRLEALPASLERLPADSQ